MNSEQKPFVPKTPIDFQKLKLERLMANPEKPVIIPEMPKEKKGFTVPEFVRNVMGSSAGAGSGEFHVYRHLRRKEYTRQKMIEEKGEKERLDEEFHRKMEENQRMIEEKTAKKRIKRLKRKEKLKKLKAEGLLKRKGKQDEKENNSEEDSSENESSNSESEKDTSEKQPVAEPSESNRENEKRELSKSII
ncbi:PRKR-interacting protein 1 like protein [Argiope bruennichi]|uniref:PRKR-interacting protein 1 like protein n=1 Tax=Argiope bruennichi TaxID=94029 RepID=A0A8T0FW64_ARGBR|nr:PRKR-interacting protein 1 like protein [Argiope bruennichi]